MDLCHLEKLESRLFFSGTPVAYLDALGVLTVEGTDQKDVIRVDVDGKNARVSFGSKGRDSTVFSNIKGLTIRGNGGDDNITANVKNVSNLVPYGEKGHAVFSTRVDGDSGKDTITVKVSRQEQGYLVVTGGDDADRITLVSTSVESFVNGGKGDDVILCLGGYVSPESSVHFGAIVLLGSEGDDRIISFVDAFLSGAEGDDYLHAIGGTQGSVFYGGGGHNYARGGSGDDSYLVFGGSSDRFYGGRGDDLMTIHHSSGSEGQVFFDGGLGQDYAEYVSGSPDPNHVLRSVEKIVGTPLVLIQSSSENHALKIVKAGSSNVVVNVASFRAAHDDVRVEQVFLSLSSGSANDLIDVELWDGDRLVGVGVFIGTSTTSTITLREDVVVSRDVVKDLTVKARFSPQGVNQNGTSGTLVAIDVTGMRGIGLSTGTKATVQGESKAGGVKVYKAFPTFVLEQLPYVGVADGRLMRFKVTAVGGNVGISKFTLKLESIGMNIEAVNVYAFTDSAYSMPISGLSVDGTLHRKELSPDVQGFVEVYVENQAGQSTALQIPEGSTMYFEVRAGIFPTSAFASIVTTLLGDNQFPVFEGKFVGTVAGVDAQMSNNFIWSPNTFQTSQVSTPDWTNGFAILGLSSGGLSFGRRNFDIV